MLLPTRRIPGAARPSSITRRCSCSQRSMVSLTCDHHGRPLSSITASRDNHLMRSRRGTWGTASALSLWSSRQNQSASSFLRADHWPRGGACTDRIDDHAKQDEQEDEARERLDHRDNEHPVPKLVAGARKQNCICLCAWLDPRAKQQGPDAMVCAEAGPARQKPVPSTPTSQAPSSGCKPGFITTPHHTTQRRGCERRLLASASTAKLMWPLQMCTLNAQKRPLPPHHPGADRCPLSVRPGRPHFPLPPT